MPGNRRNLDALSQLGRSARRILGPPALGGPTRFLYHSVMRLLLLVLLALPLRAAEVKVDLPPALAPSVVPAAAQDVSAALPEAQVQQGRELFDLAAPKLAAPLAALKTRGYAVVPAAMKPEQAQAILAAADAHWPDHGSLFSEWELYGVRAKDKWDVNLRQTPAVIEAARAFTDGFTRVLNEALPNEGLTVNDVRLRLGNDAAPNAEELHVDGSYVTVTVALRGPGTVVYEPKDDGSVYVRRALAGEAAAITNRDRWFLTNAPATVHSSPKPTDPKRVLLLIRYSAARSAEIPRERRPDLDARAERRAAMVERRLAPRPPPRKKGWLSRWLGE